MTRPYHPLQTLLDCAVPLEIAALSGQGGPSDADLEAARAFGADLALRGDVLLYGGAKPGEVAMLASQTAHAIAVLAFCPGGVTVFGRTWEAERVPSTYYTPAPILALCEPETGSGAFLVNPPAVRS